MFALWINSLSAGEVVAIDGKRFVDQPPKTEQLFTWYLHMQPTQTLPGSTMCE
jgi:hypothetical protein